ncbi:hypothetical protein D030_2775B, partial [Vibrio parahaemolyticus AQ3810]
DVICFHARNADQRQTHRTNNVVQWFNLATQIVRHWWTIRFVF